MKSELRTSKSVALCPRKARLTGSFRVNRWSVLIERESMADGEDNITIRLFSLSFSRLCINHKPSIVPLNRASRWKGWVGGGKKREWMSDMRTNDLVYRWLWWLEKGIGWGRKWSHRLGSLRTIAREAEIPGVNSGSRVLWRAYVRFGRKKMEKFHYFCYVHSETTLVGVGEVLESAPNRICILEYVNDKSGLDL